MRTNGRLPGLWVKCDDDVVSRVQKEEAVDANMGGDDSGLRQAPTEPLPQIPRTWSAYALVYVRDDVYDTVRDADCRNLPDFPDLKFAKINKLLRNF